MSQVESPLRVTVEPDVSPAARRPKLWPPLVILVAFWTFVLAVEHIEMSMGIRFISRWIAYGLLLVTFPAWWLVDLELTGGCDGSRWPRSRSERPSPRSWPTDPWLVFHWSCRAVLTC